MKIDFLALEEHHIEHALAIWKHIKNKGDFFLPAKVLGIQKRKDYCLSELLVNQERPIAVFSWGDLQKANQAGRKKIIYGEHGIGISYSLPHPSYAGYLRGKENVKLLLCPNRDVHDAYFSGALRDPKDCLPSAKKVIIGVPKMDRWAGKKIKINKRNPTLAISFHWDCMINNETRSALPFYADKLHWLLRDLKVLGHGHPRMINQLMPIYKKCGIELVRDFNEIIKRADVYACDNSSTIFEFAFVGKPVIFMNCPHYEAVRHRKRCQNFRFWQYADIGPEVNNVKEIPGAIYKSFDKKYNKVRRKAVKDIFTYLDGRCGQRAAKAIENLFKKDSRSAKLNN